MIGEQYSSIGPICPYCGNQEQPCEPFYFDEDTTTLECGECDRTYDVQIQVATSWTTTPKADPAELVAL